MKHKLLIVVPCYNEEEVLPSTIPCLREVVASMVEKQLISADSGIVFIDDGSLDKTWEILKDAAEKPGVTGIHLAGNVGHQNALMAGLEYAKDHCDLCVSIDADLQDDVAAIEEMVQKYLDGADIVFGVRNDRTSDTTFKRVTAQGFYKFMHALGVNTVYNHADFRLMSRAALEALSEYRESHLFLRGIIADMGFQTDVVYYARKERMAGKSKYPLKKMLSFAWNGITSFSAKPISVLMFFGLFVSFCAVAAFVYSLISRFMGNVISGWTSLMISVWFLGGIQVFSIGLIGQYIGKTYMESKHRPRYHIKEIVSKDKE